MKLARAKVAQLERVMEEREKVMTEAQLGNVEVDMELYSLVRWRCSSGVKALQLC